MNPLAKYIFEQQNPEKAFLNIAKLLVENGYTAEACFTYESLCRLYNNDENKINEFSFEIKKINSQFCKNSYDYYCIYNLPVEYEFPIQKNNHDEFEIIKMNDRYFAVLYLIMILNNEEDIISLKHPICKFRSHIIIQSQRLENNDLKNHLYSLMKSEEHKTASVLSEFENSEVLMTAIYIANDYEPAYLKLMKHFIQQNKIKEAIDFCNKYYATTFSKSKINSENDLIKILENVDMS